MGVNLGRKLMEVIVRHRAGVAIFQLRGKIFATAVGDLKKVIDAHLANVKGTPKLLFDFADVSMMDSSGLGMLMGTHVAIARAGGRMAFINCGASIFKRIVRLRLTTVLEHFDNEDDAIAALATNRRERNVRYSPR